MTDLSPPFSAAPHPHSVRFRADGPLIPLDLIRARDVGEVVFIVGAGASKGSGLPLFKELTETVYFDLTGANPAAPEGVPHAEHNAFASASYDVALGLLESRLEGGGPPGPAAYQRVREAVDKALDADKATRLDRHKDLLTLARDPAGCPRLVTTNFDTLFERAWAEVCDAAMPLRSRANRDLPAPGSREFTGVLHLHGRLGDTKLTPRLEASELVLTNVDFGDAYLRSGWAARFLYDLVRRYHLVLVGYGAEDAPLKYLLSVIAADRRRFPDLKTIYALDQVSGDSLDAAAANWLAKGITPLLCEADAAWQRLYETLADWAAFTDDPQGWADRHFRSIGATPYGAAAEHDQRVMRLLLTTATNSARFRELGGDFSWIKAIESHRPNPPQDEAGPTTTRSLSYARAFSAWLNDRLHTPEAMSWTVARIAPPPPKRLFEDDANGAVTVQGDVDTVTQLQGFSRDELAELRRHVDVASPSWSPAVRRFWFLVLLVADDLQRHRRERYAYQILKRLKAAREAPDEADVHRLAEFLRPTVRIEQPWSRTDTVDASVAQTFDPFSLVSVRLAWDGHPEHREVVAALPDSAGWLLSLLRALEAELDRVYWLARQYQQPDERDWLSLTINRVATEPHWTRRRDHAAGDSDPDQYALDHTELVRVIAGAWDRLVQLDGAVARRVATGWSLRDDLLFLRLYLHALKRQELWTGAEVAQAFADLSDRHFWFDLPEVKLLLVDRWRSLGDADRAALEGRLQTGPAPSPLHAATEDESLAWRSDLGARRLAAIATSGGALSATSLQMVAELHTRLGLDQPVPGVTAPLPKEGLIRTAPDGDAAAFGGLEGAELVSAMVKHTVGHQLGDGDASDALIRDQPERVLGALLKAPQEPATAGLWRRLLRRLSEPGVLEATSPPTKAEVLRAIAQLSPTTLCETAQAAVHFVQRLVFSDGKAEPTFVASQQALMLAAWQNLAAYAQREALTDAPFAPHQGERLMHRALNTAVGDVAFLALALADLSERHAPMLSTIAAQRGTLDRQLADIADPARMLVAARLTQWLSSAIRLLPKATEELVLGPLTTAEVADTHLVLLDVLARYGHGLTPDLFARLQPLIAQEVKLNRLSGQGISRLVEQMTWRTLDGFAGRLDPAPDERSMRGILQRTSTGARGDAAEVVGRWLQMSPSEERVELWNRAGARFFDTAWPFDAVLRSPEVSQHLARVPAAAGAAFPHAVAKILPLLTPYPLWDVATIFLFAGTAGAENAAELVKPEQQFAATHWAAALDLLEGALGSAPEIVPYDLADWLKEVGEQAPDAVQDQRYRRLLRLTQR
ncbi:SIR2 family protein [Azospirillum sp. YIM DDC1]|uniref:SIR2 family protein n=1 Tax=Azospirillum aestuarii TaxID=2802052 RepID=A0ABS1I4Y0_9PROT|nr:SIR2 family protein [Azospirillum aestuarii]MBK4722101.1 SIR2 family protein [Azospirillum aestuarii]